MEPEIEGRLVSDHRIWSHRFYKQIGLTFVGLCFLIGAMYTGYIYYAGPSIKEAQTEQVLAQVIAELDKNQLPFTYTIVPNAPELIKLPERVELSVEELVSIYKIAPKRDIPSSDEEALSIYGMPVGEVTYLEYINSLPAEPQEIIFQMHDEIRMLTKKLGSPYTQVSLVARVGELESAAFKDNLNQISNEPLVYPSLRVVEAEFITQILSKQFPSQASFYRDYTDAYIADGVGYGYYTPLEAQIAAMVANDYINAAMENSEVVKVLESLE